MLTIDPVQMNYFIEGMKLGSSIFLGAAVAGIAFLQLRNAHTKVALDLFDRRYAAYHAILDAIDAREDEIKRVTLEHDDRYDAAALRKFWKENGDARFLFGKDVADIFDQMDTNLREQSSTYLELRQNGPQHFEVYSNTLLDMLRLKSDFRTAVERYMAMGHIAVKAPPKRRRKRQPIDF